MFTVCPKCAMSLAVTTGDLRVGQGYVRCGRCSNVFNALLTLSEEPAAAAPGANPSPSPASGQQLSASGTVSMPAPSTEALEANVPLDTDDFTAPPMDGTEVTESDTVGTGTFETIVLEGDGILQTEEMVPQEEIDHELSLIKEQVGQDHFEDAAYTDRDLHEFAPLAAGDERRRPAIRTWAWAAGSVLLLFALAAQAIHHWRNDLAARAGWYEPMTRLYSSLGIALNPAWDLAAYDLRQQGANGDETSGAIRVRISLANHGRRAQPMPILRLTLLDRYGKRVASRDLQPRDYLSATQAAMTFLLADQRVDSEFSVKDPGPEAASFELDTCLPGYGNAIRCANDESVAKP